MFPRAVTSLVRSTRKLFQSGSRSLSSMSHPFKTMSPETVTILKLNNLYDNPGAVKEVCNVGFDCLKLSFSES
jgi:hypothetical protein